MEKKDELLQKLFHNQCSKAELELLLELIQADNSEVGPKVMAKLSEQLGDIPDYEEDIFTRIQLKIDKEIEKTSERSKSPKETKTKRLFPQFWLTRMAASILILAGISWTIIQFLPEANIVEQTAFGEIKEINLPDGSKVSLNGNSSLTFASNWEEGDLRSVYLDGEAFFEVEKKLETHAKFQVITRGLTIEVLGTSFNVNHRNESTEVFLEEGEVKLKSEFKTNQQEKVVLMKPGEVVNYSVKEKVLSTPKQISGRLQTSWKTGMLNFDDATIEEVLKRLAESNEFRYKIEDEKIKQEKITTSIPIQDIDEAISIITKTTGVSFAKIEGVIIFSSKDD